jgi:hypothetical protein
MTVLTVLYIPILGCHRLDEDEAAILSCRLLLTVDHRDSLRNQSRTRRNDNASLV